MIPPFSIPFNFIGLSLSSPDSRSPILILAANCHAGEAAKALGIRH